MRTSFRLALAAVLSLGAPLTGCAPLRNGSDHRGGVAVEDGALVLTGVSLEDGQGDLLSTMIGKVPNFRVRRVRETCPQITLRNAVSYQSVVNPHVYVDGARATDTCILESLQAHDVGRVEVYPSGFTNRPGYGRHAHGLILVFMRDATT
ncbi:MAG TPA: hypothetical protein VK936_06120 [Longimicrobiales bacterium]|nr:hypothetical protein [Longimicrobiales bacterium]